MDQVATFAHELPAWTGLDGLPLSWRHFVHGMSFIGRNSIRRVLDQAAATRGGMATEDSYANWRRDVEIKA